MKNQVVLAVALLIVCAVFAVSLGIPEVESSQRAVQSGGAIAWEYGQLYVEGQQVLWTIGGPNTPIPTSFADAINSLGVGGQRATLANLLNAIGENGWEMVNKEDKFYVFKRPRR